MNMLVIVFKKKKFRSVPTGQNTIAQDGVERTRNAILGRCRNDQSALKGRHNLSRPCRAWVRLPTIPGVAPALHPRLSYPVPLGRKSENTFLKYYSRIGCQRVAQMSTFPKSLSGARPKAALLEGASERGQPARRRTLRRSVATNWPIEP